MTVTIILTDTQVDDLDELVDLAEHGRDDFQPAEVEAAARWRNAKRTTEALRNQRHTARGLSAVVAAASRWADAAEQIDIGNPWEAFNCGEIEAAADVFRALGRPEAARQIVDMHREDDDEGDDPEHLNN